MDDPDWGTVAMLGVTIVEQALREGPGGGRWVAPRPIPDL